MASLQLTTRGNNMLTREEAIEILASHGGECLHLKYGCCQKCRKDIINLLKPEQPRRKVVHTSQSMGFDNGGIFIRTVATYDDGTMFERCNYDDNTWHKLPPIPQDDDK